MSLGEVGEVGTTDAANLNQATIPSSSSELDLFMVCFINFSRSYGFDKSTILLKHIDNDVYTCRSLFFFSFFFNNMYYKLSMTGSILCYTKQAERSY